MSIVEISPQKKIERLERKVKQLNIAKERLQTFINLGKAILVVRDMDKLMPLIMKEISNALAAERSTLFLVDWEKMQLWTQFAEGLGSERIKISITLGLVGFSILTRKTLNVPNAYQDPRFHSETDKQTGFRTASVICAPFFSKMGEPGGVIELLNKKSGLFTEEDEQLLGKFASRFARMSLMDSKERKKAIRMVTDAREAAGCERGSLFLFDKEKGDLYSVFTERLVDQDIRLSLKLGVAGLVAVTGQELNINNAYTDPRFDSTADMKTGYRTKTILCMPIHSQKGDILGVIEVINKKKGHFTKADTELLRALSSLVAISTENTMLFEDQQRQFWSILEVLAASIDAKDHLTMGHSKKVTQYAIGIGRELGYGETELDIMRVSAMLHDYGKLGIDERILKKPGKLTPEEYEHIKEHVIHTRNILNKMHFLYKYRNVPSIASAHHETLDGKGYSEGLSSQAIPFMAKIITIADIFEALTADRHYRKALDPEEAFKIIEKGAGTKYDENIIKAFSRYWKKSTKN